MDLKESIIAKVLGKSKSLSMEEYIAHNWVS